MATGDIKLPENMQLVQQGSHFEIVWKWSNQNLLTLGIATAVVGWLVGSQLGTNEISLAGVLDGALRSVIDNPFPFNLFGPVFTCAIVWLLYSVSAQIFNRTRISVSHERIVVRHGPLPWLGNREVKTSDIRQIFTRINPGRRRPATQLFISYDVLALTRNGDTIKLLSGLGLTSEQASFIERKLEASMGIKDALPGTDRVTAKNSTMDPLAPPGAKQEIERYLNVQPDLSPFGSAGKLHRASGTGSETAERQVSSKTALVVVSLFGIVLIAAGLMVMWSSVADFNRQGGFAIQPLTRIVGGAWPLLLGVLMLGSGTKVLTEKSSVAYYLWIGIYTVPIAFFVLLAAFGTGNTHNTAASGIVEGRESPDQSVITREQGFDLAKAGYEKSFPGFAGEARPATYFEGAWRRQGKIYRNDLRRLEIRPSGDQLLVRMWHECSPGSSPCDSGEVAAQVVRNKDGLIVSLAAQREIPDGRIWMRMARSRQPDDSAVIVTQVYLRDRPEWQVSSGGPVALWREKPAVPVADFLGDWSRSFPGEIGDLTRLSLREATPGKHVMRVWARCEEKRECDLGEAPLQIEAEAGGVRAVRSKFITTGRELLVSLEPPRQGRSFAVSENSEVTLETVSRGRKSSRSVVQETGRSTATRRIALHRGHPAEPFATVVAAGPLGVAPVAEGGQAGQACNGVEDLHLAVMRDCIDRLSSLKSGLEQRNRLGQTPLAVAVLQNKPDMVKELLAQGADINAPIKFAEGEWPVSSGLQRAQRPELAAGSTPLIMARDAAMASLLMQAGAEKNVKNGYGWSAVFYYTHHGSIEMLDALLAAGADINATANVDPSHLGTTALMWAAYMNRTAHLQTLLKYQPKRDVRDAAGKTALDYAKGFGHADAVRLLSTPSP
jgi:hypothetical protein